MAAVDRVSKVEVDRGPDSAEKQRGVIRNILAGQFKGVADVRLRINFTDQLGALQAAATAKVAVEATDSFVDGAKDALDGFLENPELSPEQRADVTETAKQFLADVSAIDGTVTSSIGEFEQRLESLGSSLGSGFASEPEPVVISPDAAVETEAETVPPGETVDASSLLADAEALMEYLEAELAAAVDSVNDSPRLLSPLSGASGKGAAYAKFLAIYEGKPEPMPSESGTSEPATSLDVSA